MHNGPIYAIPDLRVDSWSRYLHHWLPLINHSFQFNSIQFNATPFNWNASISMTYSQHIILIIQSVRPYEVRTNHTFVAFGPNANTKRTSHSVWQCASAFDAAAAADSCFAIRWDWIRIWITDFSHGNEHFVWEQQWFGACKTMNPVNIAEL